MSRSPQRKLSGLWGRLRDKPKAGAPEIAAGIDHVTPYFISGWIVEVKTGEPVALDLKIDGTTIARGLVPDIARPDLMAHYKTKATLGFHAEFAILPAHTEDVLVEVLKSDTGVLLASFQRPVYKRIGNIETIRQGRLIGWCYDAGDPNPTTVDIAVDGSVVQTAVVDKSRSDVIFPGSSGRVGFEATLPATTMLTPESVLRVLHHKSGEPICSRIAAEFLAPEFFARQSTAARNAEISGGPSSLSADYNRIAPFFDPHFYVQTYPIPPDTDPIDHYLVEGWKLGYDPAPWFSTRHYLEENRDVFHNNRNAFAHYVTRGYKEGRTPVDDPDTIRYKAVPDASQDKAIHVSRCLHRKGYLLVEGFARHPDYPGLPVRLDVSLGNSAPIRVPSRSSAMPAFGVREETHRDHLFFSCRIQTPEVPKGADLRIALAGRETTLLCSLEESVVDRPKVVYPEPQTDWEVVGSVDGVSETRITGWAKYSTSPNTPLTLVLSIGDEPVSAVTCHLHRTSFDGKARGVGFTGFVFDLPPEATAQMSHTGYSIAPAVGENRIRRSRGEIPRTGAMTFDPEEPARCAALAAPASGGDGPVSAIVLNLNGENILRDMFDSAAVQEDSRMIEWIIVDHGSEDGSEAVAQAAADRGQRVRFVRRDGNLSFSNSNNFGARLAEHDTLLFVNNDLIFRAPFRSRVLEALADPGTGAVGTLLYDYLPDDYSGPVPVQHVGVAFSRQIERTFLRPLELRPIPGQDDQLGALLDRPVVTGAFLAMRRADFEAVGGFSEEYVYGLEDVDLCLKVRASLGKRVVCDTRQDIVHHRGFSRRTETNVTVRQRNNNRYFNKSWALPLRRAIRSQVTTRPGYWTGATPVVAFAVAGVGENSSAGEYFTAYELGRQLQKIFPCQIRFLTETEWYNLEGVDILVAMVSHFNIQRAKRANPFLVSINWTRQWFDRWAENDGIYQYDLVFASSRRAADYLSERTGLDVHVLPIATDYDTFDAGTPQEELKADYCFTGNFAGTPREIMFQLRPETINAEGAVYGHGWGGMSFESIWRGPVSYHRMPDIYASSKIVIDDANIATKDWGSCNSRVFDAIAGGCLLITNGAKGVQELFGDLVPTFDSAETLRETIEYWTGNEDARRERVRQLQEIVKARHRYVHRAETVAALLENGAGLKTRVAIKCGAIWAEREGWGDYHFAQSLAAELRKLGFVVRVDCREQWTQGMSVTDDVNIVLRGIKAFDPPPHQLNILWLISHPADIPVTEINRYDHVFTASHFHCDLLRELAEVPVEPLLQCTDITRFHMGHVAPEERGTGEALFVGNSRGIFRTAVRWAVETDRDIDLYGKGWEQFVSDYRLKGQYIPNARLPAYYEKARVVLCDHWSDMSRYGYLSNRAFDVLACGAWLAVDEVAGLEDILPGGYTVFRNRDELGAILDTSEFGDLETRLELADWVARNHSFRNRAKTLAETIRKMLPADADQTGLLSSWREGV